MHLLQVLHLHICISTTVGVFLLAGDDLLETCRSTIRYLLAVIEGLSSGMLSRVQQQLAAVVQQIGKSVQEAPGLPGGFIRITI